MIRRSKTGWIVLFGAIVVVMGSGWLAATYLNAGFPETKEKPMSVDRVSDDAQDLKKATFGGGCFWCTEAIFQRLRGVDSVVSGYAGGDEAEPTYKKVLTGRTGHAEVVQITYDPELVSYASLLEVFWKTHDPTTPNRQGADVGTQYRSVILYHDDEQRKLAEEYRKKLDASGAFDDAIVTQIVPFEEFHPAEDYHQNYYATNPRNQYCAFVIGPKLEKLERVFHDKLKSAATEK